MPHDDPSPRPAAAGPSSPPGPGDGWKILVVDSDPALADSAREAMADYRHDGQPVAVLAAASAAEARAILDAHPDLALVLLEAVLETERAGLDLVTHIRKDLGNQRVRLVVVTAHPDRVPERAAVEAYEISDYRTKDSLSVDALRTRIIGALRTFATLQALAASRKGMGRMMVATVGLLELKSSKELYAHLLPRATQLIGLGNDALLCVQGDTLPRDGTVRVRAGSGRFRGLRDVELDSLGEPRIAAALGRLGPSSETILEEDHCALRLKAHGGITGMIYVEGRRRPSTAQEWQIVELFRNKAAIALENALLIDELNSAQRATVMAFASLAEHKDAGAPGHLERIARLSTEMARELMRRRVADEGLDQDLVDKIGLASMLHDVGMLSVADETLAMPGELVAADLQALRRHTEIGHRILSDAARPLRGRSVLAIAARIARHHHERYDGSGYLEGLRGDAIPIEARIVAVADVFDALITSRPYRRAWPMDPAIAYMRENAGRLFDPDVVDAFLAVVQRILTEEPDWFPRDGDRPEPLAEAIGRRLRGLFGMRTGHMG